MAQIRVYMERDVTVRQECHERYMSAHLHIADHLEWDEIHLCECFRDFFAE